MIAEQVRMLACCHPLMDFRKTVAACNQHERGVRRRRRGSRGQ